MTILYMTDGDDSYCGECVVMHRTVISHVTDLKLLILCVNDTSIKTNEMKKKKKSKWKFKKYLDLKVNENTINWTMLGKLKINLEQVYSLTYLY